MRAPVCKLSVGIDFVRGDPCRLFGIAGADGARLWAFLNPDDSTAKSAAAAATATQGNIFTKDSDLSHWLRIQGAERFEENFKNDGFEIIEHLMSSIEEADDFECVSSTFQALRTPINIHCVISALQTF